MSIPPDLLLIALTYVTVLWCRTFTKRCTVTLFFLKEIFMRLCVIRKNHVPLHGKTDGRDITIAIRTTCLSVREKKIENMKRLLLLCFVLCLQPLVLIAQNDGCPSRPADSYQSAQPKSQVLASEITQAFPAATTTKAEGRLLAVYGGRQLLGYGLYSKPASNGITGYVGETPLFIALDKDKRVLSVRLLDNEETHFIVDKVFQSRMLNAWNGLSLKKARKKSVDAVTGATFTSNSIIQSFKAAAKHAQ